MAEKNVASAPANMPKGTAYSMSMSDPATTIAVTESPVHCASLSRIVSRFPQDNASAGQRAL
jgi:hypothetical protein